MRAERRDAGVSIAGAAATHPVEDPLWMEVLKREEGGAKACVRRVRDTQLGNATELGGAGGRCERRDGTPASRSPARR